MGAFSDGDEQVAGDDERDVGSLLTDKPMRAARPIASQHLMAVGTTPLEVRPRAAEDLLQVSS
jgi:hypothetical protein